MPDKKTTKIIKLSQYAGFCEGVKRAYDIVEKISKDENFKKPIFVMGSLVHNSDVVKKICSLGVEIIDPKKVIAKYFGSNKAKIGTLVITAHGIGPDFYNFAKQQRINIADTTCPKVIKVQRLAKIFSEKSCQVIIIGEKNHKEVRGILEWSGKKAEIIEKFEDFSRLKINPKKKIVVISQTTQNANDFNFISRKIKRLHPKNTEIFDTLCSATHSRQKEIREMAKKCDAVVVIGSPESANSKHLWEIAKEINENSFFIEGIRDISKKSLKKCSKIGVSAGASTPPWVIQEVCNFLEKKL